MRSREARHEAVRRYYDLTYTPGSGRFAQAGDARISPDGRRVIFTGTLADDLDLGTHDRIGLIRDGTVIPLTDGPGDDHHPRWSPDGRCIGFLSDRRRAGQPQLQLLEPAFGVVVDTPYIDGVVESFEWSPDGRSILVCVAGLEADRGDVAGPGRATGAPQTQDGPTAAWKPSVREHPGDDRTRQIWIYSVAHDTVRRVTSTDLTVWEATWCGGSAIVAVTSAGWTEGAWFDADLRLISVDDGMDRMIYRGHHQIGKPACPPSGRRVAVISGLCSDRGIVPGEAILVDPAGFEHRALDTGGVDVTELAWLDDDRLAFIGIRGLDTVAGIVEALRPGARAVDSWVSSSSCGRHIPHASFARDGSMAVVHDDYSHYPAIAVVTDGVERVDLSLAPPGIEELLSSSGSVETVTWKAPDGETIDGWLCRPTGAGPFPLVLHVHGGPVGVTTNAWAMGNDTTRLLVAHGYAVLHPNPRGSYGRGQAFVRKVLGDMGGADAEDLLSGVDAMVACGVADPCRLAVLGTSYGGFMANLLPTRDDRFAAAISMSPVTDWESFHFTSNIPEFATLFLGGHPEDGDADVRRARSPLTFVARSRTPTLEVAGLRDLCTPGEQAVRFFDALSAQGTRSRLLTYPQAGHGVQHIPALKDLCEQVLEWLDEHLT